MNSIDKHILVLRESIRSMALAYKYDVAMEALKLKPTNTK